MIYTSIKYLVYHGRTKLYVQKKNHPVRDEVYWNYTFKHFFFAIACFIVRIRIDVSNYDRFTGDLLLLVRRINGSCKLCPNLPCIVCKQSMRSHWGRAVFTVIRVTLGDF